MSVLKIGLLIASLVLSASGQVSMQFAGFQFALTHLSDSAGIQGQNGLTWGIVVDTQDDGFGPFAIDLSEGATLEDGLEVASGDFFFIGGVTSEVPGAFSESGPGGVGLSRTMPVHTVPEVMSGQKFAVVWFDTGVVEGSPFRPGVNYGLLTHPNLLLPANGASAVPFQSNFAGNDPIRPANLEVQSVLPEIECGIVAERFAVEFEVDSVTTANVTFDLEKWVAGNPGHWEAEGVAPTVVSTNGNLQRLRLSRAETVGAEPAALVRVRAEEAP